MFTVVWGYPLNTAYQITQQELFERFGLLAREIPDSHALLLGNACSNCSVVIEEDIVETTPHPDPVHGGPVKLRRGGSRAPLPRCHHHHVGVREAHLPLSITKVLLPGSCIELDGGQVRILFDLENPKVPWAGNGNGRRH